MPTLASEPDHTPDEAECVLVLHGCLETTVVTLGQQFLLVVCGQENRRLLEDPVLTTCVPFLFLCKQVSAAMSPVT